MMKKIIMIFLFISYPAWCVDLYQVQISVADTTEEQRLPALNKALEQILIKLTGVRQIELSAEMTANVEQWAEQFSYQSKNSLVWLDVAFNKTEVDNLIKKLGLEIWSESRPIILAWIAYQNEIINETHQVSRMQTLKDKAEQYGITVIFPIFDLYERRHFPLKKIENYEVTEMQQLAKRYAVDTVLVGYAVESQINWYLFYNSDKKQWSTEQQPLNKSLISGIEQAINNILPQSVQDANAQTGKKASPNKTGSSTESTNLTLEIGNVSSLAIYAKINHYLKQLPDVQKLKVKNTSSSQLQLEITVKTTAARFAQILQESQFIYIQSQTENSIVGRFEEN